MIYWLGLIMFLVVQMAEGLVPEISQYDGINSQLPHQGMRVLLTAEKAACPPCGHVYGCMAVVFVTIHYTQLFLFSLNAFRLYSSKESFQLSVKTSQGNHNYH